MIISVLRQLLSYYTKWIMAIVEVLTSQKVAPWILKLEIQFDYKFQASSETTQDVS